MEEDGVYGRKAELEIAVLKWKHEWAATGERC